jgi:hypothetical protein
MRKATFLQEEIARLQKEIAGVGSTHINANAEIARRQSEIFVAASQLAEISTRRLARLTWALITLTFALLIFTITLYKDTHFAIQREKAQQHDNLQ